jgi:phosphoglucomutase/phosphomannomutase
MIFGTGGIRALMGPGKDHLNVDTIRSATQGFAQYLIKEGKCPLSIVIGFDSRHHSEEFAYETARVLSGNGIRAYLLDALRPTPYVSFACRFKGASGAVMITASHNSKEYNGYKVYWSDGAQVVFPHDEGIMREMHSLNPVRMSDKLIERVKTASLDTEYLKAIAPLQKFRSSTPLSIAYTSLHGTGITLIPAALVSWGFSTLHLVGPQVVPDGDFPTAPSPNPELPQALALGIATMRKTGAELLLASDPDADRLGVVVRHQGEMIPVSGNALAALLAHYLCTTRPLLPNTTIVTSIVTTELLKKIASSYNVTLIEVLTGFKYIGEQIHLLEPDLFLLGAEESCGYLIGTHARDKDAIVTSCLVAEMAQHAKEQGLTLVDRLHALYQRWGIHREQQLSFSFKENPLRQLRLHPPCQIASCKVLYMEDYTQSVRIDANGKRTPLTLPTSDVLLFRLEDGSRLVIRPSGTEPKVKIYASMSAPLETGSAACDAHLATLLEALKQCTNSP